MESLESIISKDESFDETPLGLEVLVLEARTYCGLLHKFVLQEEMVRVYVDDVTCI